MTSFLNSFICYMKLTHVLSVGKDSDGKESKIDRYLAARLEDLIRVGK